MNTDINIIHSDGSGAAYVPDHGGLICGHLFRSGTGSVSVGTADAVEWMGRPAAARAGEFIWLHFNLSHTSSEKWIRANLQLSDAFYGALTDDSRSTRIENDDDTLVAVINDVAYDFAFEPSEISTLWLTVTQHMLVSARVHPLRAVDRLRQSAKQGDAFNSPVELLTHLMRDQGDALVQIVRKATQQVDLIEDKLLAGSLRQKRGDLGRLRRVFVRLQRLLAPEPAALFRLLQQPPRWMAAGDLADMRQATEEFSLVIRDLAVLQERIRLLQEELAAQVSEHTNRSLFILTMVTVLALPINIVAGLMGMNVGGIPMAEDAHGFITVVLILFALAALIGWATLRKIRE
jgi:zinc transporter